MAALLITHSGVTVANCVSPFSSAAVVPSVVPATLMPHSIPRGPKKPRSMATKMGKYTKVGATIPTLT
ncbi:MAG TPA: hypothetical protein VMB73_31315 [Acetobacteraceae bacterium]|nr:hypothetical protein [Acetobacteraceae bacterium]